MKNNPISKKIDNTFSYTYLLFYFILSISYSSTLIEPVLIPRQIVLSLFVLVLVIFYTRDKSLRWDDFIKFANLKFLLILFLLLVSISLSTIFSYNKSLSIYIASKYLIEIIFLIFTSHLLIIQKITINNLCKGILIFTFVQLISASIQAIDLLNQEINLIDNINITGVSANKNLLASYLYLSIPFLIYICLSAFHKTWKTIALITLLYSLSFIYMLQSKTVFLALIFFMLVLVVLLLIYFTNEWSFRKRIITWLLSVSLLFLGTLYLITKKQAVITQILKQNNVTSINNGLSQHNKNTTLLIRFTLWENSIQLIKESPILGKGPGNWILFFPKYGLKKMKDGGVENGSVIFQNPHNDWILLWTEMGIFGLLCYVILYILGIYFCLKNIKQHKNREIKIINILILSGWIGLFVIHTADFPLERIEHQIIIYTMFAIVVFNYYSLNKYEYINIKKNNGRIFSVMFTLLTLFSIIITYNRWKTEKEVKLIKEASLNNQWNIVIQLTKELQNIYYNMDPSTMPIDWYTGVAYFNLNQLRPALEHFEKAYQLNPYNINVINNFASCYSKLGKQEKAIELYKKALHISPSFKEVRLNLSAVYYKQKNFNSAMWCLLKYSANGKDDKFKLFIHEITRAYLNNDKLSENELEKYYTFLKNKYFTKQLL